MVQQSVQIHQCDSGCSNQLSGQLWYRMFSYTIAVDAGCVVMKAEGPAVETRDTLIEVQVTTVESW